MTQVPIFFAGTSGMNGQSVPRFQTPSPSTVKTPPSYLILEPSSLMHSPPQPLKCKPNTAVAKLSSVARKRTKNRKTDFLSLSAPPRSWSQFYRTAIAKDLPVRKSVVEQIKNGEAKLKCGASFDNRHAKYNNRQFQVPHVKYGTYPAPGHHGKKSGTGEPESPGKPPVKYGTGLPSQRFASDNTVLSCGASQRLASDNTVLSPSGADEYEDGPLVWGLDEERNGARPRAEQRPISSSDSNYIEWGDTHRAEHRCESDEHWRQKFYPKSPVGSTSGDEVSQDWPSSRGWRDEFQGREVRRAGEVFRSEELWKWVDFLPRLSHAVYLYGLHSAPCIAISL